MARRVSGAGGGKVFLADADCLPQTLAVLRTRAEPLGIQLVVAPVTAESIAAQPDLFGVLLQFPGASALVVWWTHHYDKVLDAFTGAAARAGADQR